MMSFSGRKITSLFPRHCRLTIQQLKSAVLFCAPIDLLREMLEPGLSVQMGSHSRISCDGCTVLVRWRRRNVRIQVNPSGKDHGVSWGKHHLTAYQFLLLEHNFIETDVDIHCLVTDIIFPLQAFRVTGLFSSQHKLIILLYTPQFANNRAASFIDVLLSLIHLSQTKQAQTTKLNSKVSCEYKKASFLNRPPSPGSQSGLFSNKKGRLSMPTASMSS
jgi:hypothetical protein